MVRCTVNLFAITYLSLSQFFVTRAQITGNVARILVQIALSDARIRVRPDGQIIIVVVRTILLPIQMQIMIMQI